MQKHIPSLVFTENWNPLRAFVGLLPLPHPAPHRELLSRVSGISWPAFCRPAQTEKGGTGSGFFLESSMSSISQTTKAFESHPSKNLLSPRCIQSKEGPACPWEALVNRTCPGWLWVVVLGIWQTLQTLFLGPVTNLLETHLSRFHFKWKIPLLSQNKEWN